MIFSRLVPERLVSCFDLTLLFRKKSHLRLLRRPFVQNFYKYPDGPLHQKPQLGIVSMEDRCIGYLVGGMPGT